ncbi:MAG: hypothetical protein H6948_01780 [Zoogloeaceae bacterium]|nr:hypothetical protein [Zoogloeaceae bacterium]
MTAKPVVAQLCQALLCLALVLSAWTASANDEVDEWQRQWNHVLGQMQEEADLAGGRASQLLSESTRLRDVARARLANTPDGELHTAVADYERAQLSFDKARQAIEHAQRLLRDLEVELRHANPGNLRVLNEDVRGVFQQARRQLEKSNDAMRAGIGDYNAGLRRFDDAPGEGSAGVADFVRAQSQEKAFQVTRMIAHTKSALIELRDQRRFLKSPDCEPEIRQRYQQVLDSLTSANRAYLDADSVPAQSDLSMAAADAAFAQARDDAEAALTHFESCLRR